MKVPAWLLSLVLAGSLHGQAVAPANDSILRATIRFHFDRPGTEMPAYDFAVNEDGTGTFEQAAAGKAGTLTGTLAISAATTKRLFAQARELKGFTVPCASHAKNIAKTGNKTLTYAGPDLHGSCTFDYTENKNLDALTATFQGMQFTLDEGRKLAFLHRYDRLGLSAEMGILVGAVKDGRALEMGNIAAILKSLAQDMDVLEKVRLRAAELLATASP